MPGYIDKALVQIEYTPDLSNEYSLHSYYILPYTKKGECQYTSNYNITTLVDDEEVKWIQGC